MGTPHEKWNVIKKAKIWTNLTDLIQASETDKTSLAVFKPKRITKFSYQPTTRNWDPKKLEEVLTKRQQARLFDQLPTEHLYKLARKIPYNFYYHFEDEQGKQSKMKIGDWEVGALYLNCINAGDSEEVAVQKVLDQYGGFIKTKDLSFFLGTTYSFHNKGGPNPFTIIGVYYPPKPTPKTGLLFD